MSFSFSDDDHVGFIGAVGIADTLFRSGGFLRQHLSDVADLQTFDRAAVDTGRIETGV